MIKAQKLSEIRKKMTALEDRIWTADVKTTTGNIVSRALAKREYTRLQSEWGKLDKEYGRVDNGK